MLVTNSLVKMTFLMCKTFSFHCNCTVAADNWTYPVSSLQKCTPFSHFYVRHNIGGIEGGWWAL